MAQTLKLKRSAVSGNAPSTGDLALGEIAINTYDGKIFIKKDDGTEAIVTFEPGGTGNAGTIEEDNFTGNGSTTAFTLSSAPSSEENLLVFVEAAFQNRDSFTISGTTITFDDAPDTGTSVRVFHVIPGSVDDGILTVAKFAASAIVTEAEGISSNDNDTTLPTSAAVKDYVDSQVATADTLSEVLANGNTTGGTDISVSSGDDITFADSSKAIFGAGSDLQIFHDGSNSYVSDVGTGNLILKGGGQILLQSPANENMIVATGNGAVSLWYDNALKLSTTSTGINVTGNIVVSGTVDGRDVATDGTKLDTIETSATADQTQAEINALGITATGLSGTPNIGVGTISSGNITTTGYLAGPATFTIDPAAVGDNTGTVVIAGNLQVDGTTTTINSTTLTVDDKLVTLASGSANAAAANGAGIEVDISGATNPSITYDGTNDEWDFNKPINLTGDGHDLLINSADYELVLLGNRGSTGVNLDKAYLRMKAEGTNTVVIDTAGNSYFNGGNVGIGTTSPDAMLRIDQDAAATGLKVTGGSGGINIAEFVRDVAANVSVGINGESGRPQINFTSAGNTFALGVNSNTFEIADNNALGTNTRFSITNTGNVGIGIDAPTSQLHLHKDAGTAYLKQTNTANGQTLEIGNAYSLYTGANGAHSAIASDSVLAFATADTERMRIDSSGNVGIGTTSPEGTLHVENASNNALIMDAPANRYNAIGFQTAGVDKWWLGRADSDQIAGDAFFIGVDNGNVTDAGGLSSKLVIDSSGKVGIGTSSPAAPLDIHGAGVFSIRSLRNTGNGGLSYTDTAGGIRLGTSNGTTGYVGAAIDIQAPTTWVAGSSQPTDLRFFTVPDSSTTLTERLRITSSGNVGIGTTSPTSKVHISGTSDGTGAGADAMLHVKQNGTWDGNEPWALYVEGYSYLNGFRINAGDGIRSLYKTTSGGSLGFATSDTAPITFTQSASAEKMRIHSNGFVGIGTTAPAAKLQVEEYGVDTTTTSTTATTQVAIHTFAAATFRSARFTVQITNSTDSTYHLTEILMIHDGTTPSITEYGTIFTGSAEATFDADISSGNVRLLATPATTDSMAFKVVAHTITT